MVKSTKTYSIQCSKCEEWRELTREGFWYAQKIIVTVETANEQSIISSERQT